MLFGTVVGNVWCTKKAEGLTGQTFLLVAHEARTLVCADRVGAGEGDLVLVAQGAAARLAAGDQVPIDAAVIGIVDRGEGHK